MKTGARIRAMSEASASARGSAPLSRALAPGALATPIVRAMAVIVFTFGLASAQVGTSYCTPSAVPNSTGSLGRIAASGTSNLTLNGNRLNLRALSLPAGQFGLFLTSRAQSFVAHPGGSQGHLCLGGTLGRYVRPGQIQTASAAGSFDLLVDLSLTPEGGGFVQVAPGETWNFQAWHRDRGPLGQAWSNFSDGLEVTFTSGVGGTPIQGMMPIPSGTFMMGSNAPSTAPYLNTPHQQPAHQVTISYSFWMGQYEVTQAEYQALMGVNPAGFLGATRPVEQVSWIQARAFCAALTAQQAALGNVPSGYEYRLPTEAEWEYACRGGTTTEFHFGPDLFCNQARFEFSYHSTPAAGCGNPNGAAPVGSYAPNSFGLHDMHGNVKEWCLDIYATYGAPAVTDPFVTGGPNRVLRGGSWFNHSYQCRSASRSFIDPINISYLNGFRVVLAPVLVP